MGDEVVDTRYGKFLINPNDCVGTTLKAGTLWDGPGFLMPIACEYGHLGEEGWTILDVGANIGSWTVWLARENAWRVVAVEPIPQTLLYLKANLDLNQPWTAPRVILLEVAAYDHRCRMQIAGSFNPDNLGATALVPSLAGPIQAAPLDDYVHVFGPKVGLIKIDTQGSDGKVLHGLQWTLAHYRPVVVFEWEAELAVRHTDAGTLKDYEKAEDLQDLIRWLKGQRYTVDPWPAQPNNYLARPR